MRLAEAEAASVIDRMRGTFDTYWADDGFEDSSRAETSSGFEMR